MRTLCYCGTISRANLVFYAPNRCPSHKDSIHGSHVHQGCMPVITRPGFVSVTTFWWPFPWDIVVLSGPWGHWLVYICDWLAPSHAQVTKEGCSGISTRGFSVKSGAWGCSVINKNSQNHHFLVILTRFFASVGPFSGVTRCFMVQIDPLYIKDRYIGHMSTRGAYLWSLVLVLWVLPLFEGYPHGIILYCQAPGLGPLGCI